MHSLQNMIRALGLLSFLFLLSCSDTPPEDPTVLKEYLHLSHTRTDNNPNMNTGVQQMDLSSFDMLWLGGDMAYLTSEDEATMTYVDGFFDFGNVNTLWALGNHDYSDLDLVSSYTNREAYYTTHKNGITFLVLDTQDDFSQITGDQLDLVNEVLDTIESSTHLMLLSHKLIWMYGDNDMEPQIATISNGSLGSCFYCLNPNNFYEDIYPRLLETKNKGIEVICVGGDLGVQVDEFEFVNDDQIHFVASGVSSSLVDPSDPKLLLFTHDIGERKLSWSYMLSSEL